MFDTDDDRYTSQQGSRRTLPTSIQPQVPNSRSINLGENAGSSQTRETFGNTYSAQPKLTLSVDLMKNHTAGRGSDDRLITSTSGSRILPHYMMPAKSTSTSQHPNSVDPVFRSTAGEERSDEYDERLIFQAALQVVFSGHYNYYLYISLFHSCRWLDSESLRRLLFFVIC